MHRDLAWPDLSDFQPEGGLHPLTRWLAFVLLGGAATIVLAACASRPSQEFSLWLLPGALIGHHHFVRKAGQVFRAQQPRLRASDNMCTALPASSSWGPWIVLTLLMLASGPLNSLGLLLAFFPLLMYRFYSRLWIEVDLEQAQVCYHRTFGSLQISRSGSDLQQASAVLSGLLLEVPGERNERIVAAWVEGQGVIPLSLHGQNLADCHQLGRRWAAQLGLPHYQIQDEMKAPEVRQLGELVHCRPTVWKNLPAGATPPGPRPPLPPGGDD